MATVDFFPGTVATSSAKFSTLMNTPSVGVADWTTIGNAAGSAYAEMNDDQLAITPTLDSATFPYSYTVICTNFLRTTDSAPIASVLPASAVVTGLRFYANLFADVGGRAYFFAQIRSTLTSAGIGTREFGLVNDTTKTWWEIPRRATSGEIFGTATDVSSNGAWTVADMLGTGFGFGMIVWGSNPSGVVLSVDGFRCSVDYPSGGMRSRDGRIAGFSRTGR